MKELIDNIFELSKKPPLFERGEVKFWDDPHISKSMLKAHLDPESDAASRCPESIDKIVLHLTASGIVKPGMKLLDLGCGPGLYAERFSRAGVCVTGVDISERSLEYARKQAAEKGMKTVYRSMNFFDMDYSGEFDAVIQVYGELNVFPDGKRDELFGLVHRALKKEGMFIFDITTRELRRKHGVKNRWYICDGGFWRPERHLVLEQGFDYPEEDVWLDQYTVVDGQGCKVYRNWFHDYSLDTIRPALAGAGFEVRHVWSELTGSNYVEGGDWIAIAAVKKEEEQNT